MKRLSRARVVIAILSALTLFLPFSALSLEAAPAGQGLERFIVVLHEQVGNPGAVADELSRRHGGQRGFVYEHALKGFSVEIPAQGIAGIARDPRVAYVERDQEVFAFGDPQPVPTGINRIDGELSSTKAGDGSGTVSVDVAIIDTGIASHPDLPIISGGVNCTGGSFWKSSCKSGNYDDGNGHGTHVAGTVAALDNDRGVVGVAPGARLWAVKVLNNRGSGYTSWIIAGIDWVTAQKDPNGKQKIEVANMSLGCECYSKAQDDAITRSVAAGVTYAVAAGNSSKDASTFSPANHPDVITVSALADFNGLDRATGGIAASTCRDDVDDTFANFSNYGKDVDIIAPGVCINSTWLNGGYNTISGTSMASPHVAGAAALYIANYMSQNNGVRPAPLAVRNALVTNGNLNWDDSDDPDNNVKEPLLNVAKF